MFQNEIELLALSTLPSFLSPKGVVEPFLGGPRIYIYKRDPDDSYSASLSVIQMGTLRVVMETRMRQATGSGLCSTLTGPLVLLQVGNTALIVFVSYFGSRVHRPRLIGCGAILVALAGLLMALPHFISEPYRFDNTSPGKSGRAGLEADMIYCITGHQGPSPGFHQSGWAQLPRTLAGLPHPSSTASLSPSPGGLWLLGSNIGYRPGAEG